MKVKPFYNPFTPWKIELFYLWKKPFHFPSSQKELRSPKKILLCNQGALGDVFLTLSMIPSLKKQFPKVSVGLLIDPASRVVVEHCPLVDEWHELKSWFRPTDSKKEKLIRWLSYQKKEYLYDWVICSFPFYRGVGSSFRKIPSRICFETLGDRSYFNWVIPWKEEYIGQNYIRLLKTIGIKNPTLECPWNFEKENKGYVLFHMGSSDASKEWPLSFWQDVAELYRKQGKKIVFTGRGKRQRDLIEQVALPEENECDQHTFVEFLQRIANADHILTVDTITLHVAAILKKTYFAFFKKEQDVGIWYPNTFEGACIL